MKESTTTQLVIYIIGLGLLVLTWGIAFGYIKSDVNHIDKQTNKNTATIESVKRDVTENEKTLVRIDTRQEVIIEGINEIKTQIRNLKK